MPTYEYACNGCGQRIEVSQSFSDPPLTTCPSCGGDLRKVYGSVGIVLKGSGFYRTDSRSASANGKSKAASSTDGAGGAPGTNGEASAAKEPAAASSGGAGSDAKPGAGAAKPAGAAGASSAPST